MTGELKRAGADPKDLGEIVCVECSPGYQHAAIRKNRRGRLYVHCYACGVHNADSKPIQDRILASGRFFKPGDKPAPAAEQTPDPVRQKRDPHKQTTNVHEPGPAGGGFLAGLLSDD